MEQEMTLSGIRLVRQTFGDMLPKGWSVAQAYLSYKHDHDVEWQVITFHVIGPDGKTHVLESDKVPARDDVNELAAGTARKFLEGLKNVPPTGSTGAASG
jgi:hypothetical protein